MRPFLYPLPLISSTTRSPLPADDPGTPASVLCASDSSLPANDKVPHQRLLLKLKPHGIGDGIIDWIEQWLTDRRQRVVVDGEVSNWK